MVHANACTNLFARKLIVERVAAGWPAMQVAEQLGVSRARVYKWLCRYAEAGEAGLADRCSRPRRMPNRTPARVEKTASWLPAGDADEARLCWPASSG